MVYAVCVIWPFSVDHNIGMIIVYAVVACSALQYLYGMRKRLRQRKPA